MSLTETPAWIALQNHFLEIHDNHMRDLFDRDPQRFSRFSLEFNDILIDYSKNRVTDKTMSLLTDLASQEKVNVWAEKMFNGEQVNGTEKRAVLHTALRNQSDTPVYVNGTDVMPGIRKVLADMGQFAEKVRSGEWKGFSGKPIKDIVNIGIGGSDLGPAMVTNALRPFHKPGLYVHFVSNVEGSDIADTLEELNPETTLFLIASKTFTTWETMSNAKTARAWIINAAGNEAAVEKHFTALSANREAVTRFGINPDYMFEFWDWVGGRYSLWSAIGLSIILYIGMENFEQLLIGAYEMDCHFRNEPFEKNIPVILAVLGIWYNDFFNASTCAILPYEQHLSKLPAYLQQLDMESNGKHTTNDGKSAEYAVGPIIWGALGGKGQHAFYQLLHQGARLVPADFLVPVESYHPLSDHHEILVANCLAQTEALMRGKSKKEAHKSLLDSAISESDIEHLLPHKTFPGNTPTNTIMYQKLTPRTLGTLLAMYEHKVFTQGIIWNINSFDQMGVELGKELAYKIFSDLSDNKEANKHDCSTNGLINYYKENSKKK